MAALAPPKCSTKARFMNLHRLVKWANQILGHEIADSMFKGAIMKKMRAAIMQLPACRKFIQHFLRDAKCMLKCQKILKNEGLYADTAEKCRILVKVIPHSSTVRKGFTTWLEEHLDKCREIGISTGSLPITSDQIESLFGVAKQHGVGEIKDANRIALRLPAITGEITKQDAERVLQVTTAMLLETERPLSSLTKQRRQVLPNPGTIENLIRQTPVNLELIPESKNPVKNQNIPDILIHYEKSSDLNISGIINKKSNEILIENVKYRRSG